MEVPGGHTVLIDGGGFGDNTVFDVGARVVAPFLWRKKIKTVETLVLSHPNSDHLNGLLFIAENFNTSELWANGEPADNAGYHQLTQVFYTVSWLCQLLLQYLSGGISIALVCFQPAPIYV